MSEERLEDFRYRMMIRGYMNKKEFQKFMDCGYKTATKLWNRFLSVRYKGRRAGMHRRRTVHADKKSHRVPWTE